ncbi:PAS domain S-box protein [Pelomonas sp. V22]|uniref:PAS domain S-box protein n=1 Tax=Pelomonas sp. V22 TaxID=2822139 RepID=UPI0024A7E0C5|nr:PAS domain S-box protein [Pelomonas sp. V22]MDI4635916.1 PAS domain S-box protein [Pelomonas sp. V22]
MKLLPQAAIARAAALPFATRLLGFGALVLLPLLCFSGYSLWRDRERDQLDAQGRVHLLAIEAAADAQRELDRGHRLLAFLRERPEVVALDSTLCNTMLRGQLKLDPLLANAGVLDLDKHIVCSSVDLPTGLKVPLDGGRWWAEALSTQRVIIPAPIMGRILGKPVLGLVQALRDKTGRPAALMMVSVDLLALSRHWTQLQLPAGSELTILNSDGVVVTRSHDPKHWIGKDLSVPLAALRQQLPSSADGVLGPDGVRRIYSVVPMSQPGWTALAGLPVDAVFAPARDRLRVTLYWAAGALGLALLLGFLLARHLSAPLRQLQRSASAVADGRRDTRASESGPREFRSVSIEFNRMLDSLHAAESRARRIHGLYEALSRTNRALMRGKDKQALCTEVCAACVDAGHALLASVWLRDDQDQLRMFASAGPVLTLYGSLDNAIDLRDPELARTPTGEAVMTGLPAVANDYLNDARTSRWHELAHLHGVRGVAVVPLKRQGRVEAALVLHVAEAHWFDEPLMQLLAELADDIALGFDILDRDAARAQAEAQLVHSRERFQRLFQAAPLPAAVFDHPNGRLLDANQAFVEAMGLGLDQLRGHSLSGLGLSHADAQRLYQRLREQRGRLRQFEAAFRQRDGRVHEVQINAEQIEFDGQPALLTLSADMTLRKRTEQALRESLARFELAASTGHVWAWRPDGGLKAPTALLDLLGFADEEMGHQPGLWLPEVHEQDRSLLLDTLRRHLSQRTPLELEFRMCGRDGKEHWLHASGQTQWDESGQVRQMAGIVFDVSEHRRMQSRLASREQQLGDTAGIEISITPK